MLGHAPPAREFPHTEDLLAYTTSGSRTTNKMKDNHHHIYIYVIPIRKSMFLFYILVVLKQACTRLPRRSGVDSRAVLRGRRGGVFILYL